MLEAAGSPWVYVATAALVLLDAFLIIVPSETVVVALGALALSTGSPNVWVLIPVAAVAAAAGDNLCFALGRAVGTSRWAWMRRPRVQRAIEVARRALDRRAASVILTARYVPFARIAVNLTAGATGFSYRRYLPLTMLAGLCWAVFNVVVGASVGSLFPGQPLAAVAIAVVCAIMLGIAVDLVTGALARRRDATAG